MFFTASTETFTHNVCKNNISIKYFNPVVIIEKKNIVVAILREERRKGG